MGGINASILQVRRDLQDLFKEMGGLNDYALKHSKFDGDNVIEIDWSGMNLTGSIPESIGNFPALQRM